jgi:probable F420-dependent oxidoreductase
MEGEGEREMKVGICCVATGPWSTGRFIRSSARAAERAGFDSYWLGDHIVLFDAYPGSSYPYKGKMFGDPPMPDPRVATYDPLMGMCWAAAATETIGIGSSIVILPHRNPVILAKQVSGLDEFSGGRVTLGVGVGWCREEMEAIGGDWPNRGRRTDEYVAAMRALWRNDRADFVGETVSLNGAYMYPKPVHGDIAVMVGGMTDVALRRVARIGDGWLAFNLDPDVAAERVALLKRLTREQGRDPEALRLSCAVFGWTSDDDIRRYHDAGITELLLFKCGELAVEEGELAGQIDEAADRYLGVAAKL